MCVSVMVSRAGTTVRCFALSGSGVMSGNLGLLLARREGFGAEPCVKCRMRNVKVCVHMQPEEVLSPSVVVRKLRESFGSS